jgi:hypothetical protein
MADTNQPDTFRPSPATGADTLQRLDIFRHRNVIIYGAGKIGQRVYQALRRLDVGIESIWDINASLIRHVDNVEVVEPEPRRVPPEKRDTYTIIITIFSETVAESIRKSLLDAGYVDIIVDRTFINDLLLLDCTGRVSRDSERIDVNNCIFCPRITTRNSSCPIFFRHITDSTETRDSDTGSLFAIPSMGVLTTTRCTLTCEGCNHLRDHFKPENNFDIPFSDIVSDLETLLHSVDVVNKLVIVGGEAFLHPKLDRILLHVLSLKKVGIVHIITNGTVVPKDDKIYSLLSHNRVIVEISGYGDRLPRAMRTNVATFIDALVRHGVNHRHTQTMQWFDFGGFERRDYSEEQMCRVFSSCCFVSNDLFNGRLYTCSRSALGTYLEKLPDYPDDYVDLRKPEQSDLRSRLTAFFAKKYAHACRHCNGTSAVTIEAGCQARSSRPEKETTEPSGSTQTFQKGQPV